MASSIIGFDLLIGKLISFLESEASLIANVDDKLREIQLELQNMKSFLQDAQSSTLQTQLEKTWVAQIRDTAFEIQDVIDELEYRKQKCRALGKLTGFVYESFHFPKHLWDKRQLASKLKKIQKTAKVISDSKQRYHVDRPEVLFQNDSDWLRTHHEKPLFLKDEEMVGFKNDKAKIMGWLLNGQEMNRSVISVCGIAGSGKTTLVANAYNDQKTKTKFDCYAWVTISQRYQIKAILEAAIKDLYKSRNDVVPTNLSSMGNRELVDTIVKYLRDKRYIIVLDDVWSKHVWDEICHALPDDMQGSRVILTTRFEEVASDSFGAQSHLHHMEPLKKDEAFHLFCKKAFPDNRCPTNLEEIAWSLVKKCEGLPFALVALSGSLSSKKLESEWSMVDRSLTWQLSNNAYLQRMNTILLLSYHALPYRLKLCFLYCSLFPQDYAMWRENLIRLWLAEGFLEDIRGLTPEEVGEKYIMELVGRSLLQVIRSYPNGQPIELKMHDIFRELAISISTDEKFCTICKDEEGIEHNNKAPVLSIQAKRSQCESRMLTNLSKVRSFFMFVGKEVYQSSSATLPSGFKFLKVLNLEGLPIDNRVFDEIVNCYNLRYLNLAQTNVSELPKRIGNLSQLCTLNLNNTHIQVLPSGIAKLHNLRHLIAHHKVKNDGKLFNSNVDGVRLTRNICGLKNLQILTLLEVNKDLVGDLKYLINLRRLELCKVTEEFDEEICLAIEKMECLYYLFLMAKDENEVLGLGSLRSTAPRLIVFKLAGKLAKVPRWFKSLQNIMELSLFWTRFDDDVFHS